MSSKAVAAVSVKRAPVALESPKRKPTSAEIAERAYEIFLCRGGAHGSDLEDWFQAERELRERD